MSMSIRVRVSCCAGKPMSQCANLDSHLCCLDDKDALNSKEKPGNMAWVFEVSLTLGVQLDICMLEPKEETLDFSFLYFKKQALP